MRALLQRVSEALARHGALVGATDHSTTKSLYGRDPDGLEFEIVWLVPADLLDDDMLNNAVRLKPPNRARLVVVARHGRHIAPAARTRYATVM